VIGLFDPMHFERGPRVVDDEIVGTKHSARDHHGFIAAFAKARAVIVARDLLPDLAVIEEDDEASKRIEREVGDLGGDAVESLRRGRRDGLARLGRRRGGWREVLRSELLWTCLR
jgi:hypothetical protein